MEEVGRKGEFAAIWNSSDHTLIGGPEAVGRG